VPVVCASIATCLRCSLKQLLLAACRNYIVVRYSTRRYFIFHHEAATVIFLTVFADRERGSPYPTGCVCVCVCVCVCASLVTECINGDRGGANGFKSHMFTICHPICSPYGVDMTCYCGSWFSVWKLAQRPTALYYIAGTDPPMERETSLVVKAYFHRIDKKAYVRQLLTAGVHSKAVNSVCSSYRWVHTYFRPKSRLCKIQHLFSKIHLSSLKFLRVF